MGKLNIKLSKELDKIFKNSFDFVAIQGGSEIPLSAVVLQLVLYYETENRDNLENSMLKDLVCDEINIKALKTRLASYSLKECSKLPSSLFNRDNIKLSAEAEEVLVRARESLSIRSSIKKEEGWVDAPDLDTAMIWFNKAAAVGHHLAIKRLTTNENETQY